MTGRHLRAAVPLSMLLSIVASDALGEGPFNVRSTYSWRPGGDAVARRDVSVQAVDAGFEATLAVSPCAASPVPSSPGAAPAHGCGRPEGEDGTSRYRWNATWTVPAFSDGVPRVDVGIGAAARRGVSARDVDTTAEITISQQFGSIDLSGGYLRAVTGAGTPSFYGSLGWYASNGGLLEFHVEADQQPGGSLAPTEVGARYTFARHRGGRWALGVDRTPSGIDQGWRAELVYSVEF